MASLSECRLCKNESEKLRRKTSAAARERDNARKRNKRREDPAWAAKRDAQVHSRAKQRYQEDPEYRERIKAKNRAAYAKKVALKRNAV